MPTEKLYWDDGTASEFDAVALGVSAYDGRPTLTLDRTLFYPEGGGQLADRGTIVVGDDVLSIIDSQIDDEGVIHHVLGAAGVGVANGAPVRGKIDVARRRDHAAQHTAQHALSRALADVARAETVSARLGATTCTIDVARSSIPDGELHRAEDLVAALIESDVPVTPLYPSVDDLRTLPLRKAPKVESGPIRLIQIEGFDLTPCGGTHCARTGQIGQARIVGLEKYKGMLRLTFHAGMRALADARAKHEALSTLAADLTCGVADVPGAIGKLRGDLRATRAQLELARDELAGFVAQTLLDQAATAQGPPLLAVHRPTDDIAFLRLLANKLAKTPKLVILLTTMDPQSGELLVLVQRGAESTFDSGAFIKSQRARGGGRPDRAEGKLADVTPEALADELRAALALSSERGGAQG